MQERTKEIQAVASLFDEAVADARPVRAAALAGNTDRAMVLMRGKVTADLSKARQGVIDLVDGLRKKLTNSRTSYPVERITFSQLRGSSY